MVEQARAELLAAAEKLSEATNALTAKFEGVDRFSHETRDITRRLAMAYIGLVVALVFTGIAVWYAGNANDKADRAAERAHQTCEVGNDSRALLSKTLTDLIGRSQAKTAAAQAKIAAAKAEVIATFAPRDCDHQVASPEPSTTP